MKQEKDATRKEDSEEEESRELNSLVGLEDKVEKIVPKGEQTEKKWKNIRKLVDRSWKSTIWITGVTEKDKKK